MMRRLGFRCDSNNTRQPRNLRLELEVSNFVFVVIVLQANVVNPLLVDEDLDLEEIGGPAVCME